MGVQKGKHYNGKKRNLKNKRTTIILTFFLLTLIIIGAVFFATNKNIADNFFGNKNVTENEQQIIEQKIINMPDKIGDYDVLGVIVIDKLGVEKNILNKTTDDSLNLSVTKFYGPNLNEIGNFCITGHNYKDVFANADNLEKNDTFYIVDKANATKVNYKIYDKYTVSPTDLECLNQETKGKKEVTLITCNPGGLTRLILKAQEI